MSILFYQKNNKNNILFKSQTKDRIASKSKQKRKRDREKEEEKTEKIKLKMAFFIIQFIKYNLKLISNQYLHK